MAQSLLSQQIAISIDAVDGSKAAGTIDYTGHPSGGIDAPRSFQLGNVTYTINSAAIPFNANVDTIWQNVIKAVNNSTSLITATLNTTLSRVTFTYNTTTSAANTFVFSNNNVQNATFSGGGVLSGGVSPTAFPATQSFGLIIDGRGASVTLYEQIGTETVKVKDDDPRIGDISVYNTSDNSPNLRITFMSDFTGSAVVVGGVGLDTDIVDRLEDLETAVNSLINITNNKLARTIPTATAIDIVSKKNSSLENRITNLEDKIDRLIRITNTQASFLT